MATHKDFIKALRWQLIEYLNFIETRRKTRLSDYLQTQTIDEAFPKVDPQLKPLGSTVLVQIKQPAKLSKGGLILPEGEQKAERDNTQLAMVVAMGPLAFHNRNTLELWPEGAWVNVGDFVRVPRYGGDRYYMPNPLDKDYPALFVLFEDLNMKGLITGDPLAMKAFV
jgi:co-chaperonin GroES (HSP10)